jgi:hypothetical protein
MLRTDVDHARSDSEEETHGYRSSKRRLDFQTPSLRNARNQEDSAWSAVTLTPRTQISTGGTHMVYGIVDPYLVRSILNSSPIFL